MIKSNSIKYFKANFILVIKTKFPFFDFFYAVLGLLLQFVRNERAKAYAQFKTTHELESYVKRFEHRYMIRVLKELGNAFLDNLALHKPPTFEKSLIVNWSGAQINLFVPERQMARYAEALYGFTTIVSGTSWSSFYTLLVCLLLEKNIVFVHDDRETVAKYMYANQFIFHVGSSSSALALPYNILS